MRLWRPTQAVLIAAAWSAATAASLGAQATATVESGVSRVHYDEFLPSAAASLGVAFATQGRTAAVSARTSYLLFESGNSTWQAALAGSSLAPQVGPVRPELWAATGGSRYGDYPGFWHALGGARFHLGIERGTAWVDGSIGRTSFGESPRPVAMIGAGLWTRRSGPTVTLAASYVRVGDTTYTDLQGTARARRGATELDGVLGTRAWSRGGGHGVYAEASVALSLGDHAALVIAGGRYPTDPTRGTISGRYVSAALRLRAVVPERRSPPPAQPRPRQILAANGSSSPPGGATPSLEAHVEANGSVRLVVYAVEAASVEIAGDFTDWQPVTLWSGDSDRWQLSVRIAPGAHRVNVRLDGGPWIVPRGTTVTEDDFGGRIGIFVVP